MILVCWPYSDLPDERHAFRVDLTACKYSENCAEGFRTLCGLVAKEILAISRDDPRHKIERSKPICELCERREPRSSRIQRETEIRSFEKEFGYNPWKTVEGDFS